MKTLCAIFATMLLTSCGEKTAPEITKLKPPAEIRAEKLAIELTQIDEWGKQAMAEARKNRDLKAKILEAHPSESHKMFEGIALEAEFSSRILAVQNEMYTKRIKATNDILAAR